MCAAQTMSGSLMAQRRLRCAKHSASRKLGLVLAPLRHLSVLDPFADGLRLAPKRASCR